ncbi:LytR/AlgR family response regulator transcription factor [Haliscomenobacter hydrossis]|uniref:Two component transcriptional regulator, LytTR family n=1 Tax=Haliscomenobacter hydrossis (strain ATCC 27775 / DSM 1100 / LMG 10767 / O) TaxID=760192 RepID=F4KQ95_HALH1|nr:LytTR family DNA-binding domain-containing protein [Haliscomenobacter hydrossis]AEE48921.1 two component transcriptional regulator, LytTR family [Haliscomenobacter hydrossis DSM 1100]
MKLSCLIIDDEPPAHVVLERYIEKIERLTLQGHCYNALDALNFLHQHPIDLLFLDIDMPELSGLELLTALKNPPRVILTTAYAEFALEGYEYGVVDYLLKPIRFERFIKAVDRLITPGAELPVVSSTTTPAPSYLLLNINNARQKIDTADIVYIAAAGNYVQLHFLQQRPLLANETMSDLQKQLSQFIRVHKSYLINVDYLSKLEGNRVYLQGGAEIPIGVSYKQSVLSYFKV